MIVVGSGRPIWPVHLPQWPVLKNGLGLGRHQDEAVSEWRKEKEEDRHSASLRLNLFWHHETPTNGVVGY
jgi:hypothetical protein